MHATRAFLPLNCSFKDACCFVCFVALRLLPHPQPHDLRDFTFVGLKPDNDKRPLWVTPDARVFLEVNSPVYKQVEPPTHHRSTGNGG